MIPEIISLFLELDKNLALMVQNYGALIYPIVFLIIFAETGLVITPFLPGDSLLFAAGAMAAIGSLNIVLLLVLAAAAAIIGDSVNYWIGNYLGPKVFRENSRFFKREYLLRAQGFYERHGGKTIVIARFIPIVRTFAPFVAGIGKMKYSKFLWYNILGGLLWVSIFIFGGYLFGNIPFVKNNFSLFILIIIVVSISPLIIEFFRNKYKKSHQASQGTGQARLVRISR
jgi:membrane-associated protein